MWDDNIMIYEFYSREDGCWLSVVTGWLGARGAAGCNSSSGMPFTSHKGCTLLIRMNSLCTIRPVSFTRICDCRVFPHISAKCAYCIFFPHKLAFLTAILNNFNILCVSVWTSMHCRAANTNRTCAFERLGQLCNYSSPRKHTWVTVTMCVQGVSCGYMYDIRMNLTKTPQKIDRPIQCTLTNTLCYLSNAFIHFLQ